MPKHSGARYRRFNYGSTAEGKPVYKREELSSPGRTASLLGQLGAKTAKHPAARYGRRPMSDAQRKAMFAKGSY